MLRFVNLQRTMKYLKLYIFQASYNAFVSARNDVALDVGHALDLCRSAWFLATMFYFDNI